MKSQYKKGEYAPGGGEPFDAKKILAATRQIHSAPQKSARHKQKLFSSLPSTPHERQPRNKYSYPIRPALRKRSSQFDTPRSDTAPDGLTKAYLDRGQDSSRNEDGSHTADILKVEFENEEARDTIKEEDIVNGEEVQKDDNQNRTGSATGKERVTSAKPKRRESKITIIDAKDENNENKPIKRQSSYIDTSAKASVKFPSLEKSNSKSSLLGEEKKKKMINIPRFVQLGSLHAGKVFVCLFYFHC